jgi:hypothetical protein
MAGDNQERAAIGWRPSGYSDLNQAKKSPDTNGLEVAGAS